MHLLHEVVTSWYILVFLLVGLESIGLPVPGEPAMVAASVYAASTGHISIAGVIAASSAGAIFGGMTGFGIGRRFGPGFLKIYGPRIGLTPRRQKVGRYLFAIHGTKIVCISRFFTVARTFCSLLAGINQMKVTPFLIWNLIGGIIWPIVHCSISYAFGERTGQFSTMAWIGFATVVVLWFLFAVGIARRHEERLSDLADKHDDGDFPPAFGG